MAIYKKAKDDKTGKMSSTNRFDLEIRLKQHMKEMISKKQRVLLTSDTVLRSNEAEVL